MAVAETEIHDLFAQGPVGTPPPAVQPFEIVITFDNPYPGRGPLVPFTDEEKAQVQEACNRWRSVWASDDFRAQVQHAKFQATDDSSALVYQKIMQANPKHANYVLTTGSNGSETAISNNVSGITCLHRSWLASTTGDQLNRLVNTISHEYTHTAEGGKYFHAYFQRLWGKNAVPLLVGNLTETIANKMFPAS